MPKSDNQKAKILYILDYLEKYSHEAHPVRASELIAMLERDHFLRKKDHLLRHRHLAGFWCGYHHPPRQKRRLLYWLPEF